MKLNIEEALQAKAYAEKYFAQRDFTAAMNYALKAHMLCPELDGISQMIATFGVYTASEVTVNGELDLYGILGLEPSADKGTMKKQYKKMAVLLHPDKNKSMGADGAFKLVLEAWTILSDHVKRSMYDQRRNFSVQLASGFRSFWNSSKSSVSHHRLDTFWTVCTSCHVQYEYLRKYVNKRLSCKNCHGVFLAIETGAAPENGAYPYGSWSYVPEKGYGNHGCGSTYTPCTSEYFPSNGVSGHHSGHGSEHASNVTAIQWNSFLGAPAGVLDPNKFSLTTNVSHQVNGKANRMKANRRCYMKKIAVHVYDGSSEQPLCKPGRPAKKRMVDSGSGCHSVNEESSTRSTPEVRTANDNGSLKQISKFCSPNDTSTRHFSASPAFGARQFLIDKARTGICKKLEEMRFALAAAETDKKLKALAEIGKPRVAPKTPNADGTTNQSELERTVSMLITVPDSDFHDFDKDRSEECFKPKQIWALYDGDGMPRLYCLIREVISVKPFKIHISYLSSKTDSEFGSVNWLDSGFTKCCGNFRVFNSEIVEQVNIFSHLLTREKAGRGGCVRIYPRRGDIWAVYRDWSPDWNRMTPDEVRHQYEMVEILDDYSEELGVCVTPLVKVDGYKTVYQRNANKDSSRWIPRGEMLRFSHQVPSSLLNREAFNLTDYCWDLDPAATPDQLLQRITEIQGMINSNEADDSATALAEQYLVENNGQEEIKLNAVMSASGPCNCAQPATELQLVEKHCPE